ncbi:GntR family transcriptional regulator [Lacticaseibacillus pantheris]
MPSEGELEQKYGVSRITVRRAVSELVTENFFGQETRAWNVRAAAKDGS